MTPDLISQGGSHEPADPPRFYRFGRVLGSPGLCGARPGRWSSESPGAEPAWWAWSQSYL